MIRLCSNTSFRWIFEKIHQNGSVAAKEVINRISEAGLEHFLGGPIVLYREAVGEFFRTASLSGDKITVTVGGKKFEITEESVVEILRLPTDGQNASMELAPTTFEAACQILSADWEPVKVSGKKSSLRPEYISLCNIFTKSVQARGGNYDNLTKAKIEMLIGLLEGTKVNWAKEIFHNMKDMVKTDEYHGTALRR